jgi:hypothetical protein
VAPPIGGCLTDENCPPEQTCAPISGQCISLVETSPGLEVVPPAQNNQGWVPQEFPQRTLGPDGRIEVRLEPGVSLEGSVFASNLDSSGHKQVVPSRVVARRESDLPGRPRVQVETVAHAAKADGQRDTFVLWLHSQREYTFYVAPQPPLDALYPPLVATVKVAGHLKRDFVLEGKDRAIEVRGRVTDSSEGPLDYSVRVRAFQPDGLYQSTVAETAFDTKLTPPEARGVFAFRVPASSLKTPASLALYTLRVESAQGSRPIPTMDCPDLSVGLLSPGAFPAQQLPPLPLPTFLRDQEFTLKVKGDDGTAVTGATVEFRTPLPGPASGPWTCTASYSQTSVTDTEGKVLLKLLPGDGGKNQTYTVTVLSPASSPFANLVVPRIEVGPVGGLLGDLQLTRRPRVRGAVLTPASKPVAGATLEAQPKETADAASPSTAGPAAAMTNSDGAFELYLEPGIYDINVRPPEGTELPSFLGRTALEVAEDVDGLLLSVPSTKILRGSVLDPQGRQLPNAQIQVYDPVPANALHPRAALRGRSITDSHGSFYVPLPAVTSP